MTQQNHQSNRLIHETSPYLLQHAHNPVDWYAWGEEAFEKARKERKPILLSIGYSACHWCHVMEAESFENDAIAQIMNDHFVCIKVDREERPDLDQIYQTSVQFFIQRGGGWPLTMFLTPEKVPFYGGTYFPPEDRYQLPGFPSLLQSLAKAYDDRPEDIAETVRNVQNALQKISEKERVNTIKTLDPDLVKKAARQICQMFDENNGGFGGAPKFPSTPALSILLRYYHESADPAFLKMVTFSLGKMARGGVYDQLGGGFHRYSVDEAWQVPHFEKMLYDNAQLARLYFQTFQASGEGIYQEIGTEILDYVIREMTAPEGGFYASQDADSEGGEGSFFVWTPLEVTSLLGNKTGNFFCQYYNITDSGNFEGKNIPHLTRSLEALSKEMGMPLEEAMGTLKQAKEQLLLERMKRPAPMRDGKVITSWNSLMISAFVEGYQVSRNKNYLAAAIKAADFITTSLYREGSLLHTFKDGMGKLLAYLDDTTYFIDALLDLYEATSVMSYLKRAESLVRGLLKKFIDAETGAFFYTSSDHEVLISRTMPYHDQSLPSGNAVAAQVLLRLFYLTGEKQYFERGEAVLQTFMDKMTEHPYSTGNLIAAADFYLKTPKEIHVIGNRTDSDFEELLKKLYQCYLPNKVVAINGTGLQGTSEKRPREKGDGKPEISICQNFSCSQPLSDWEEIHSQLISTRKAP